MPDAPRDSARPTVLARRLAKLAYLALVALAAGTASAQQTPAPVAAAQPATRPAHPHVLIVSIDGARPDCLLRADMPNLRGLMRRGSFTLWATTTDIAITTPSHVSMLTGVTPERHGITFNGDPPAGAQINVPTLFDLAKQAGYSTGVASGKRKFSLFELTKHIDWAWLTADTAAKDDREVGDQAALIVRYHCPDVMLVHFPGADVVGHAIGWGTPEQIDKLGTIDQALGTVLKAYDEVGLTGETYMIVSGDHGGTVKTHGRGDVRSHFIPWVCVGPGVRENYDLTRLGKDYDVRTYDTFATACHVLDIPLPDGIDGKPVMPIFRNYDLMLASDRPTTRSDPATPYLRHAEAKPPTTEPTAAIPVDNAVPAENARPLWRGAGKVPTTAPAAAAD